MITLKKLQWDNCFSYGSNNSIDLNDTTLTQLLGKNGAGKSSIPLILEEVLFNKNSKGIKKAEIQNREFNKGYNIFLDFAVEDEKYRVEVRRSRGTIKVKLYKGKEDIFTKMQAEVYGKSIEKAIISDKLVRLLTDLKALNHDIYIISHKTIYPYKGPKYNLREAALKWLAKQPIYGSEKPINRQKVYFESTKEQKVERIKSLGIRVYIDDLVEILNPILHINQNKFTIHACCQQNFRFAVTIKIFNSSPCCLTICSSIIAIKNPIANIKKQKLKKLDPT